MRIPRVRFTIPRPMVAVLLVAIMLGVEFAFLRAMSPEAHLRDWAKNHPDQPTPELVAEGVSTSLLIPFSLANASLAMALSAAALLWPGRPDPPRPE